jgi:tetratricopeptide (TPR) repeat protein
MSQQEDLIEEVQAIASAKDFYNKNKKNIQIAGVALLVVIAALVYYFASYKPSISKEAAENYFIAERYLKQDSLNKALNGDGVNMGMLELAETYGSTEVGQQAKFYTGTIYMRQGKYQEALDFFESASFSDEIIAAQVITLRGDAQSELGNYEEAGDTYIKSANKRDNKLTTPIALKKAAIAYEESKNYSGAIKAWKRIAEDYSDSPQAANAISHIAKLEAKESAQ